MKKADDKTRLLKKGDHAYRVTKIFKSDESYIERIEITLAEFTGGTFGHWYYRDNKGRSYFNRNIGKSCFRTKEEAEQEMRKRKNIVKKRKLLKEYERKLNEELGIEDHCIIK